MILRITDGTTTADLIWHSSANRKYMLVRDGWAPAITTFRESELGGNGPYADVIEEIEINVLGETQAEVLTNLAVLTRLLDQAWRWWRGEPVSAVKIQYAPDGAGVGEAVILGRTSGDETSGVNLPITTNSDLQMFMIAGVRLRFLRRGLWLGTTETASSSSAANPSVLTATFARDAKVFCPVTLTMNLTSGTVSGAGAGFLLLADAANKLLITEAETLADGTFYTSVADAARNARGGSVLRYNPVTVNSTPTGTGIVPAAGIADAPRLLVFAVVRSSTTAVTWQITLRGQGGAQVIGTPVMFVPTTTDPEAIFLGTLQQPSQEIGATQPQWVLLFFETSVSSIAGGPTLDFDYVVVQADDMLSYAVAHTAFPAGISQMPFTIRDGQRGLPQPLFLVANNGKYQSYSGDICLMNDGTVCAAVWIATGGSNWRVMTTAPAVASTSISVSRSVAGVVPS